MIVARNLTQRYPGTLERGPLTVLDGVDLHIERAEVVVVLGPSGSGKTTLLGLLAGLDRPSEGGVTLDGVELSQLDENGRASLRAESLGFVSQNFQLIPTLTASRMCWCRSNCRRRRARWISRPLSSAPGSC